MPSFRFLVEGTFTEAVLIGNVWGQTLLSEAFNKPQRRERRKNKISQKMNYSRSRVLNHEYSTAGPLVDAAVVSTRTVIWSWSTCLLILMRIRP